MVITVCLFETDCGTSKIPRFLCIVPKNTRQLGCLGVYFFTVFAIPSGKSVIWSLIMSANNPECPFWTEVKYFVFLNSSPG